jgi:EAL domain-containing protein (putative c-di-GMP-specific phosphodiesterase class I)
MKCKSYYVAVPKAIIAMAHSLNLEVIAEGIETEEQLSFLRENECDAFQGYYCSRPVSATEMTKLLEDRKSLPLESSMCRASGEASLGSS